MNILRDKLSAKIQHLMATTPIDTQMKVAKKAGIAQATVQRVLAKKQAATVDLIERLASAYSVKDPAKFLLAPEEVDLLTSWAQLSEEDKSAILGFIKVKAK